MMYIPLPSFDLHGKVAVACADLDRDLDLGENDMSGLYQTLSEIENKENGHA